MIRRIKKKDQEKSSFRIIFTDTNKMMNLKDFLIKKKMPQRITKSIKVLKY